LRREAEKSAFGVLSEVEGSKSDSSTSLRCARNDKIPGLDLKSKDRYFNALMEPGQQSSVPKIFSRATTRQRGIAAVVFFAIIGSFAVLWLVGHYKITLYPFACGFRQRFGLPCPTCFMTRAVLTFAQGDIIRSFHTQPAAAFSCCLAVAAAFFAFLIACFGVYSPAFERLIISLKLRYIIAAVLFILAAGWAFTLARVLAEQGSF
jgi:hypothetical protein